MMARHRLAVAAAAVAVIAVAVYFARREFGSELHPAGVGAAAADFRATTVDSLRVVKTIADYKGQVLLLNVWATWCVPCRTEMPSIEKLYQTYGPRGLKVVAISVDEPGSELQIRAFAKDFHLTFEILHDPENRISDEYGIVGLPETIVVGRDGLIRKIQMAASDWSSAENRALIERLLAQKTG